MVKGYLVGLATVAGAALANPSFAQVADVTGSVTGGLQFGTGSFAMTAGVNGTARSQTQTSSVVASGRANFVLGQDDTDTSLSGQIRATRLLPDGSLFIGASYARTPSTFEELSEDFTLVNVEGTRFRTSLFTGASFQHTPVLRSGLNLSYTNTDFDPVNDEQVPSDSYDASLRLDYTVDNRSALFVSGGLGWFTSENNVATESFSVNAEVGGTQAVDATTQINGSVGVSFINPEEVVGGLSTTEWQTALLFNGELTREYVDSTLSIGLNQQVSPGRGGELEVGTSLRGQLSFDVNRRASAGLSASVGRSSTLGQDDGETQVAITPSYSYEFAEGLAATASYTLRSTDSSTSHRFGIGLSRSFGNVGN